MTVFTETVFMEKRWSWIPGEEVKPYDCSYERDRKGRPSVPYRLTVPSHQRANRTPELGYSVGHWVGDVL